MTWVIILRDHARAVESGSAAVIETDSLLAVRDSISGEGVAEFLAGRVLLAEQRLDIGGKSRRLVHFPRRRPKSYMRPARIDHRNTE